MAVIHVAGAAYAHPGGTELFADVSFRVGTRTPRRAGRGERGRASRRCCAASPASCARPTAPCRSTARSRGCPRRSAPTPTPARPCASCSSGSRRRAVRDAATALAPAEAANDAAPTDRTGMALGIRGDRVDRGGRLRPREPVGRLLRPGARPAAGGRRAAGRSPSCPAASASASSSRRCWSVTPRSCCSTSPTTSSTSRRSAGSSSGCEASPKTILLISHDRELLAAVADSVVTLEGFGAWTHPGELGHLRRGPAGPQPRPRRRAPALEGRGAPALQALQGPQGAGVGQRQERRRRPTPPSTAGSGSSRSDRLPRRRPSATSGCGSRAPTAAGSRSAPQRLELSGLTDPFDLEVHFGDRVAVLGPNGTGKSHLLRLIAGQPVDHEGDAPPRRPGRAGTVPPDRRGGRVPRPHAAGHPARPRPARGAGACGRCPATA